MAYQNNKAPKCINCQTPMRFIPAGVSKKTGKRYEAFWSCPNQKICGGKNIPYQKEKKPILITENMIRLDERDLEKILEPLRQIWKQGEEIKEILAKMKRVDVIYPNDKLNKTYLEPDDDGE